MRSDLRNCLGWNNHSAQGSVIVLFRGLGADPEILRRGGGRTNTLKFVSNVMQGYVAGKSGHGDAVGGVSLYIGREGGGGHPL